MIIGGVADEVIKLGLGIVDEGFNATRNCDTKLTLGEEEGGEFGGECEGHDSLRMLL
jgi:hypothetical protein